MRCGEMSRTRCISTIVFSLWMAIDSPLTAQPSITPEQVAAFKMRDQMRERQTRFQQERHDKELAEKNSAAERRFFRVTEVEHFSELPVPESVKACFDTVVTQVNDIPAPKDGLLVIDAAGEREETIKPLANATPAEPPVSVQDQAKLWNVIQTTVGDSFWQHSSPVRKRSICSIIEHEVRGFPSSVAGAKLEHSERRAKLGNFAIRLRGIVNAPVVVPQDRPALRVQRELFLELFKEEYRKHQKAISVAEFALVFDAWFRGWWVDLQEQDWSPAMKLPLAEDELQKLQSEIRAAFATECRNCSDLLFRPPSNLVVPVENWHAAEVRRYPAIAMMTAGNYLAPLQTRLHGVYARIAAERMPDQDWTAGISEEELNANREAVFAAVKRERERQQDQQRQDAEEFDLRAKATAEEMRQRARNLTVEGMLPKPKMAMRWALLGVNGIIVLMLIAYAFSRCRAS